LKHLEHKLDLKSTHFFHQKDFVGEFTQRIDEARSVLLEFPRALVQTTERIVHLGARVQTPHLMIETVQSRLAKVWTRFQNLALTDLQKRAWQLEQSSRGLATLSYKKTLERGFCLALGSHGKPIMRKKSLESDTLKGLQFQDGYYPLKT
jgi:exonuclease VII large subunit